MMADKLIEDLCNEADTVAIKLIKEDRKGSINLKTNIMTINPEFYNERAETFVHEMLHYHYRNIECLDLGPIEETIVEMNTVTLLKDKNNKKYIIQYLESVNI